MVVAHVKYRQMKDLKYTTTHEGKHMYARPGKKRGGLWWTYLVSLILKASFDGAFLYILYYIHKGFDLPRLLKCSMDPCPNIVDCYVSRPTEKKIFTLFMVVSSAVCILMCIFEMFYFICKKVKKRIIEKIDEETRELKSSSTPHSRHKSRSSSRVDPTVSNQNLNNIKTEETPTTK
ncbi:gap junction protein beta 9b [Haplochromis burtoni]|uniref:gap junction protein beta 9b n=1 Tax=Haplochromis burtoni TaxID=8153 RepID=UPI0006C95F75|nr:gap junction protein beta 9b [Haplochromis burtoni]